MSHRTTITTSPLRRLGVAAAAAALGGLAVMSGASPAAAGSNGQQIKFHDSRGTIYSVRIKGNNQNGQYVEACFNTNYTDNYLSGWWWKGPVNITGYTAGECTFGSTVAYIGEVTIPTQYADDYIPVSG
ncbi:hypothetical protein [Streptomyces sp. LMG1-1-1.1]|uniref:hypothetical protein n=1 Tax=Streptomyces sp. LMG1-1-1.1 TaxID=3135245 RepID=UPI0034650851